MDAFVLVAHASLEASRILLQQLIACLNFTLDLESLFCWYNWKKGFLWTMAAQPETTRKIHQQQQKHWV